MFRSTMFLTRALATAGSILAMTSIGAWAEDSGRLSVIEENDKFVSTDDRHYTQGIRFAYLSGDLEKGGAWEQPFNWLDSAFGVFPSDATERSRRIEWTILGQNLYTPQNTKLVNPDPKDRPYAGWLYTGATLIQDSNRRQMDALQVMVGVVGPAAVGRQTQNDFHQFIEVDKAYGWGSQLRNEPALLIGYDHKWRLMAPLGGGFGFDAIPQVSANVGNVLTDAEAGTIVRFGRNLEADYGPARNQPGLNGTTYFNGDYVEGDLGFYVFAGVQGRAVARNIFLDGNTWQPSPSVNKKIFVGDVMAGASVFWNRAARLDFTVTQRSKEFDGQKGTDRFGTIALAVGF